MANDKEKELEDFYKAMQMVGDDIAIKEEPLDEEIYEENTFRLPQNQQKYSEPSTSQRSDPRLNPSNSAIYRRDNHPVIQPSLKVREFANPIRSRIQNNGNRNENNFHYDQSEIKRAKINQTTNTQEDAIHEICQTEQTNLRHFKKLEDKHIQTTKNTGGFYFELTAEEILNLSKNQLDVIRTLKKVILVIHNYFNY